MTFLRKLGKQALSAVLTVVIFGTIAWAITPAQQAFNAAVPGVSGFRLTLTSGTPVTVSNVTGATTIYLTPYTSQKISVYYNSLWKSCQSAEISKALGTLTGSKPYDVFVQDTTGACALGLSFSAAWTSATARNNALATQDGVQVLSSDHTKLYVGTFFTTATTTTEDSVLNRDVWNQFNRVNRAMSVSITTDHNYNVASFRAYDGNTANAFNMVRGFDEDSVYVSAGAWVHNSNAGGAPCDIGIGVDSTTVDSALIAGFSYDKAAESGHHPQAFWTGFPGLGFHTLTMLEYSSTTVTSTFYGVAGATTAGPSGMVGTVRS